MVELFAAGCFGPSPERVRSPVPCVAAEKLPTSAGVERGCRVFHPDPLPVKERLCPEPRGGICPLIADAPASIAPARLTPSLSRSPDFSLVDGIEPEDYSTRWDYSLEPPSNRTSRSHGIRLYGPSTVTVDETGLFSLVVSQVSRVRKASMKASGDSRREHTDDNEKISHSSHREP